MLLNVWTLLGHFAAALFVGGGFSVAVMTHWYWWVDANNLDGVTAPTSLFLLHVAVAIGGGVWLGRATFRASQRLVDRHDAEVLKRLWWSKVPHQASTGEALRRSGIRERMRQDG